MSGEYLPLVVKREGGGANDVGGRTRHTKQRGIHSETLGKSTDQARSMVTGGPKWANKDVARNPNKLQQTPSVRSYKRGGMGSTVPVDEQRAASAGRRLPPMSQTMNPGNLGGGGRGKMVKPNVIVPYDQPAGKLPRRLQIERKTRSYAGQSIDELLRYEGVDYSKYPATKDQVSGEMSFLALEIFDDRAFEVRAPEEWIAEGTDDNGECFIEGRGLRVDAGGLGSFQACHVVGFDGGSGKFLVRWEDNDDDEPAMLSRVGLNFLAEDPLVFVQRVAKAHRVRRRIEGDIRYSLYVDSMPTDEIAPLDTEQVNRVLLLALNTKKLRQSALDTSTLLQEVNIDYARTMNKIIFDKSLEDPAQGLRENLNLPKQAEETVEAPYFGVVSIPFHDFSRHFSDFCFHSFNTKVEAITALRDSNYEDIQLRGNMCLFNTAVYKSIRLDEFDLMQSSHVSQLAAFMKDKWTASVVKCIKDSLGGAGKGWFNLRQTNREVYLLSKLKKFMRTVNYMMEDTLRFLVEESLAKYHAFIKAATDFRVEVRSSHHVKVTPTDGSLSALEYPVEKDEDEDEEEEVDLTLEGDAKEAAEKAREARIAAKKAAAFKKAKELEMEDPDISMPVDKQFALFNVDLTFRDGNIAVSTPLDHFVSVPLGILDRALDSMVSIPQIEPRVMEQLMWHGSETKLAGVSREEPHVGAIYDDIKARLERTTVPVRKFLKQFNKYKKVLGTDVEAYIKEFGDDTDNDVAEFRSEIQKNMDARDTIVANLPQRVWLGIVMVNCEEFRKSLIDHYTKIITKLLDVFQKQTKAQCDSIKKSFVAIDIELRKVPANVDDMVKLKEYRAQVPIQIKDYEAPIEEALDRYAMLEEFDVRLNKEMLFAQWQTFGWPKSVHDMIQKREGEYEQESMGFLSEVKTEQAQFDAELVEVESKCNSFDQYKDLDKCKKVAEKAVEIQDKLDDLVKRSAKFNDAEMLLQMEPTDYQPLKATVKNFEPFFQLWTGAADWVSSHENWMQGSFMELEGNAIADKVTNWGKANIKVMKHKLIKESPACLAIAEKIKSELAEFQPILPLIVALRNPGMRERHWEQLSEGLPFEFKVDESLCLKDIVGKYKLQDHLELITTIGEKAGKEYQIESALDKMETQWKPTVFEVPDYKDTGTYLITGVDEIMQLLDEHVVMTQAMQFSSFKGPFEERITEWGNKLSTVSEVIEEWLQVQRQWMALQSIFSSPDINKQLPAEGKRFAQVNKMWNLTMSQVHANPAVLEFCDNPNLLDKLQEANISLQMVQKRLSEYLDKKRASFARFYFLANEELLQILSQTEDPNAVQPHLKKCFENVNTVRFIENNLITSMFSGEGEEVPFTKAVDPAGKGVEYWLGDVEDEMRVTIADVMKRANSDYYQQERGEWTKSWPGQAVLGGSQIYFTREVEEAFEQKQHEGIVEYEAKWRKQLLDMVAMVRGDLTKIQRMIVGALIVLDVHARDVLERLVRDGCSSKNDFAWICQMRYYVDEQTGIYVQMVQSKFPYCNEYLGNTLRLVITPLTDRCYMTLMGALSLNLGGAPAGPAGTGKTETVKDLSKCVAKQCVVFNCSDGLTVHAMSKFFKGLASSGAWACFDEFNRINIEVLSVVAQQVQTIWTAVREKVKTFLFDGTELKLDITVSAFITMNPGYAGRTELPDNLEVLFRPVAMMVPDYGLIGEIMLYSFGFSVAKELARKMVATFKLCSEQLSAQDHYDYGMRAVKTVITRAGILKREDPEENEAILMLRGLCDVNIPKFLAPDLPLFRGIISDLFPGLKKPEIDYGALETSIVLSCTENNIQPVEPFIRKCIELYETTVVRHGLMVVGPTSGGKTTNIRTLQRAMTRLSVLPDFEKVLTQVLNPKAVTLGQLYGDSDPHTGEWSDGILAQVFRNFIDNTSVDKKWVVFDGPVDALWIENMNTVLDDNKKLCLVSGEILQLTPQMTMVFEVEDLSVASPATVSRCGMVYMEPELLGSSVLTQSWLDRLDPSFKKIAPALSKLFRQMLDQHVSFVRRTCPEPVPSVDMNLCSSLLNILDSFLAPMVPKEGGKDNEDKRQRFEVVAKHIEAIFTLSLIWSVGATTDKRGRGIFSTFMRMMMKENNFKEAPPDDGQVYDYVFDVQQEKWIKWVESEKYVFDNKLAFQEIIVSTNDSIRYTFFLDKLVQANKQVLFTGNTGTGKTVNVNQYLSKKMPSTYVPISLIFSAATSANQVEDMLFGKMQKRRARVYGPPLGKRFVIFVDDVNMPLREEYFAQPPIEILRQWMDHNGWYNRVTLQFNEILDIGFVGAMGPPGGGRNPVTPRFIRHFNNIAHTDLDADSMFLIFHTIVSNSLVKFEGAVQELAAGIVKSTVHVYDTVISSLLPTPAKVHYTFNLRDLSKVFQGVLSANPAKTKTAENVMTLWVHENQRVFKDRLINDHDRQWLDDLLSATMKDTFGQDWAATVGARDCLLYGDYMEGIGAERRTYDQVSDTQAVAKVMEECLHEYNEQNTPMGLVMFLDAIEHVSRISRVLRSPGGNALLLGVGGSGRQSLTRLATFISEYTLFMVTVTATYTMNDWHEDVKGMLLDAGLKEQPTVFLFNDTQITNEGFLEDVNNILNTGEVPNIYTGEDMDNIFAGCKMDCQRKNIPATKLNAYAQFLQRIRSNLHVVVCMSPLGDVFRTRLRMFPALVNCCTIDWFSDWPKAALLSVANQSLTEGEDLKIKNVEAVVEMFGYIHSSVTDKSAVYRDELNRHNYVTPTSYLELLNVFKFLLADKRSEVGGLRSKLQYGLDKLAHAESQVSQLKIDLIEKQPLLVVAQKDVAEMIVQIDADTKAAGETKATVQKQEAEANKKAAEANGIRDSAQAELDKALPMLDKAVESLKELNKGHIDEVRNFKKPPGGVVLTMEATCIMLKDVLKLKYTMKNDESGTKKVPDFWDTAQKFILKDPKALLETLKTYDKDNIPDKTIKAIEPYVTNEDFTVAKIEKASIACRAICMWVHAMFNYSGVSKIVEPKRIQLRESEAELAVVTEQLNTAMAELKAVEARLEELSNNYKASVDKSEALVNEVEMCKVKLVRAEKLIGGLGGEKARWIATVARLTEAYELIVGDVLVSSGTIAYVGAFTANFRQQLYEEWRGKLAELGIGHTEGCNIRTTMADPVQIRAWQIAGLPTDSLSTENGIIIAKARRWPLLIDPQGQAAKFIKNLGAQKFEEGMTVLKLTDKNFLQSLESAIRFGKWVLLERVLEELDPSLEPLLQQQLVNINGSPHVKLGENMVPYSDQFHFYVCTSLPNPHYAPELQVKVTLLNFTITPEGLEDQMLGTVVAKEMPELEIKKNNLTVQNAKMKKQLQDIEDQILKLLSESTGDILEDETLIEVLAESKKTSTEINEKVAEAEIIEKEIDESRKGYIPVAFRASLLYFCIADLAKIDPMYQYSLEWFVALFVQGIGDATPSDVLQERLTNLNDFFTKSLYENICRSLFEKHKLLFSFLLCVKILQGDDKIDPNDWRFLVAGGASKKDTANPSTWMTEQVWGSILAISELDAFDGLEQDFVNSTEAWNAFYESKAPDKAALPAGWNDKLNDFQKLMVLRCLRPDKMAPALQAYVGNNLGPAYNEFPQFDLGLSFKASSNISPIIFILSTGADPTNALLQFAEAQGYRSTMNMISLGQGQGPKAQKFIEDGCKKGGWVLLQNCHLAISWLPTLEKIVMNLKPDEVNEDFRLWLTSAPTPKFPVSVLQNGVKLTKEPSKGLRANLLQSYYAFTDAYLDTTSKPDVFKKLLYGMCFFHAIVLERRKYGPLGWNIPYAFAENDLQVCLTQLADFIDMYDEVPYNVVHFLSYDVNYGGRVTDDNDRRTIRIILDDYMHAGVLSDECKFSDSGLYMSPKIGDKNYYLETIGNLPMESEPEVFGMHSNADITSAQTETMSLFSTILTLLPKSSSGAGKTREEIIDDAAVGVLDLIPPEWDVDTVGKKYPTLYSESMNTVLLQEIVRYNRLLATMRTSLLDLRKALKGEMVMSADLDAMGDRLFNNLVPVLWEAVAYPSLMPLSPWVNDLVARAAFLQKWVDEGTPIVFWISGFFFPQAFLTGSLQNYARKSGHPVDAISFAFSVRPERAEDFTGPPETGIYIYGLYLQGCRWDAANYTLADSNPKELFSQFPPMWLKPEYEREQPEDGVYRCPVYKILTRRGTLSTTGHSTNYVMPVELPTNVPEKKWVKAGVALFTALDY